MIKTVVSQVCNGGKTICAISCSDLYRFRAHLTEVAKDKRAITFTLAVEFRNGLQVAVPEQMPLELAYAIGGVESRIKSQLQRIGLLVHVSDKEHAELMQSKRYLLARQILNYADAQHISHRPEGPSA